MNPYALVNSHASSAASTMASARASTVTNPYAATSQSAATNTRDTSNAPIATATTATANPYQRSSTSAPVARSSATTTNNGTVPSAHSSTLSSMQSNASVAATTTHSSPAPNVQHMQVPALHQLLTNLLGNREMYDSCYNNPAMVFRVKLQKASGGTINFNVVKVKKNKKGTGKKSKKKYEYMVATTFEAVGGVAATSNPQQQQHIISCRIHPDVVEQHFPVDAAELRSMSRSDREKSQQHTEVGGDNVKEAFFDKPNTWTATLHLPPDEVFNDSNGKSIAERLTDLQSPVLVLRDPTPLS